VHRLCALVCVLSSFCISVHAQDASIQEPCISMIALEKSSSAQSLAARVEEPSKAIEDARGIATEARLAGDETQVAEGSGGGEGYSTDKTTEPTITQGLATEPPVGEVSQPSGVGVISTNQERGVTVEGIQSERQTSQHSNDGKLTDVTVEPSTTAAPIIATEPRTNEASAAELARIIERILSEAMEPGDETYISEYSIEIESKQAVEASEATMNSTEVGTAEPRSEKLDNRKGVTFDGDKGKDTSVAARGSAEEAWIADSSLGSAGKPTDIVAQSRPAQMVTNEPTGLSNPVEE
jgi:hypothetical protein